ncbi:MAG TPA: alpha/beta fold hydrolase [Acidimicrobiales bacterium]|nr:alpha/beta fold hydrolase [Acidimicrobiales bacterium]
MGTEEFDLEVRGHRLHAQRQGSSDAPLALAVPGLSANLRSFDFIAERVAGPRLQLVALDLRGRGRSETTPAGTYGWENHALDVLAVADALGAGRVAILGQSMGGAVAMKAAGLATERIAAVVLLDACGVPEPGTLAVIGRSVSRLGETYPSIDDYLATVRAQGTIEPWSEYWERYYRYELEEVEGGYRSRTRPEAIAEDGAYAATQDLYGLWRHLAMPTLLLRATREFLPGSGHIVSAADRDRFAAEVPTARVVEVDANHMTINTHPDSAAAITTFLAEAFDRV